HSSRFFRASPAPRNHATRIFCPAMLICVTMWNPSRPSPKPRRLQPQSPPTANASRISKRKLHQCAKKFQIFTRRSLTCSNNSLSSKSNSSKTNRASELSVTRPFFCREDGFRDEQKVVRGIFGKKSIKVDGAPGETRTPDPLVRSQMLYPAELRALSGIITVGERFGYCVGEKT